MASSADTDRQAPPPCLFAFPLESNFNGRRYDQELVNHVHVHGIPDQLSHQGLGEHQSPGQQKEEQCAADREQASHLQQQLQQQQQQQQHRQQHEQQHKQQQQQQEEQWAADEGLLRSQHQLPASAGQHSRGSRWHVLIDAAKACATMPPDLTRYPADFVVGSLNHSRKSTVCLL